MTRFKLKRKIFPGLNSITGQCSNMLTFMTKADSSKLHVQKLKKKKRGRGSEETSAYIMSLLVSSVVLLTLEVF